MINSNPEFFFALRIRFRVKIIYFSTTITDYINRFGQSLCSTPNRIYLVGGFGQQDKTHKRIGTDQSIKISVHKKKKKIGKSFFCKTKNKAAENYTFSKGQNIKFGTWNVPLCC